MATPSSSAGLRLTTSLLALILLLSPAPSSSQRPSTPFSPSPKFSQLLSTPLTQWSRIPLPIPTLQDCTSPPSNWTTRELPCSFSEASLKSLLRLLLPILHDHGYIPKSCRTCFNYWGLPPIPNLNTLTFPDATGNV
nr:P15 [Bee Macula-like virus]